MTHATTDCGHGCCDDPLDPFHDHYLTAEQCPACGALTEEEHQQ